MKIREIIPLLSSNPLFSKTPFNKTHQFNNNEDDETFNTPKNFLSVNNQSSEIYYYSPIEQKLYVIKIESTLDNTIGSIKFQELKIKIDFEVFKIELNEDSRYLCIAGNLNCLIVDLNPKTVNLYFTTDNQIYQDKENKTIGYEALSGISYVSIDNPFSNISNIIKQVEWHPLSNIHLVILYSNNVLKIFNIKNEKEEIIEQTFNLDSLYTYESLKNFKNNKIERKNVKNFISFCFGSNINFWSRFTIFLLSNDGEIYNLCPIIPNNCLVESDFYRDFQNHIIFEKNQCNNNNNNNNSSNINELKQQKYYDQQFKWLMSASINTVPFEIDNVNWLKLSTPSTSTFSLPLLQGPIYKVSENTKSQSPALKILAISPLVSNLENINNIDNDDDDDNDNDENNDNSNSYSNSNSNQELSLEDLNSNSNNNKLNNYKPNKKYSKLVPFIISILLESCECLVNICCQDTIPMWSNIENDNGILFTENKLPRYIDLILYETLDMGLNKISTAGDKSKNNSTIPNFIRNSLPTMKYDQWSDSLYFYHNQGVQIAKFPWLMQIFYEINKAIIGSGFKNEQDATAIDENMLFDNTQLFTVISNSQSNQNIPIIGIQVFSNIKIGTYFIVLPNTFKCNIFDMDALTTTSSTGNNEIDPLTLTASNEIKDKAIKSPLEKLIKCKPAIIGRINLSNEFTQKEFLQTLVSTKKKIYNLYVYSKELEFELQSRVKTLNQLSQQQLQIIDTLKNRIQNIRENQELLNEKLKYLWDKKEASVEQVNELYKTEMEGKELSNAEKDLKKTLTQVKGQVNIYSKRLNQISNELDQEFKNKNNINNSSINDSIEYEELSEDQQEYFKKVINLHDQKIDKDVNKLINIFKSIQITK